MQKVSLSPMWTCVTHPSAAKAGGMSSNACIIWCEQQHLLRSRTIMCIVLANRRLCQSNLVLPTAPAMSCVQETPNITFGKQCRRHACLVDCKEYTSLIKIVLQRTTQESEYPVKCNKWAVWATSYGPDEVPLLFLWLITTHRIPSTAVDEFLQGWYIQT